MISYINLLRTSLVSGGLIALASVAICGTSHADFMLGLSADGSNPNFTVVAGEQSADIPVFLIQINGETRLSSVGLFSAGATISIQSGAGLSLYQPSSASIQPHWTDALNSTATFNSGSVLFQGVVTTNSVKAPVGSNAVQIGSFRVIGGDASTFTPLSISLSGLPVSDPIILDDANFTAILPTAAAGDRLSFGSGTIQSITAVPEPSTVLMLGAASLVLASKRFRRRTETVELLRTRDTAV